MSVQGFGPPRFEIVAVEGDIIKFPYAPSRALERPGVIYQVSAIRTPNGTSSPPKSGNTRHHCRNGNSLKRRHIDNRYTVKIHVGNILKTITMV